MRNFLSLSLGHPALPRTLLAEREHTPGFGFSSVPSRSCRCKTLCPPILSHPAPSCRRQELRQKDSNDVKDKETHRCSSVVRRIQSPVLCNGWCPQTHRQRFSWSGVFFALCCKTIGSSTILHKHNRLKKEKKVSHRHRLILCQFCLQFTHDITSSLPLSHSSVDLPLMAGIQERGERVALLEGEPSPMEV